MSPPDEGAAVEQSGPASTGAAPERRGRHGLRRLRDADDSFGLVLIAILVTLIVIGIVSTYPAGAIIISILFLGIFFLTLLTSGVPRRTIIILTVIIPFVLAVGGAATASEVGSRVGSLSLIVAAGLVIACVFFIFRRINQHVYISRQTIFGSLCVYLFGALLFSMVYRIIAAMSGEPFFVQTDHPSTLDYIYFSFISMATVGFGDFTPATDVGKMGVIVEAIIGQLYLVVVVALFISRIGRRRLDRAE